LHNLCRRLAALGNLKASFHCARLHNLCPLKVNDSLFRQKAGAVIYNELKNRMLMSKVFQVKPKRLKRSNGTVLTPDMVVTVTTMQHTATPFYNGAKEVQEAYMRIYAFDYKKACCNQNDFEFIKLD
jgi:hypothetical protein